MSHMVVAMLSLAGGLIALAVALRSDDPVGLAGLLAVLLLLNALIRYMLTRV